MPVIDVILGPDCPKDSGGAADGQHVWRNVLRDDGARSDDGVVPDMYAGQDGDA